MSLSTEERFASALELIAKSVASQAESNAKLAETMALLGDRMNRLTGTIQGAQRKIGLGVGGIIDQAKKANAELNAELEKRRRARNANS